MKANPLTPDENNGRSVLNPSDIKKHVSLKKFGGTGGKSAG